MEAAKSKQSRALEILFETSVCLKMHSSSNAQQESATSTLKTMLQSVSKWRTEERRQEVKQNSRRLKQSETSTHRPQA